MPAINPHKSDVEFEAAGQAWVIRLDIKTITAAEARTGKKFKEMATDESLTTLCELMRCGLQTHHQGLSLERAIELIEDLGVVRATQIVAVSVGLATSPGGMAGRDGPLKMPALSIETDAPDGTGSGSTDTGASTSRPRRARSGTRRLA